MEGLRIKVEVISSYYEEFSLDGGLSRETPPNCWVMTREAETASLCCVLARLPGGPLSSPAVPGKRPRRGRISGKAEDKSAEFL